MDRWAGARGNATNPLPGPVGQEFKGPWLQQQIVFSLAIGVVSLLVFGLGKRRDPALYLGRFPIQGAALPYEVMRKSIVQWIAPILLYSDHSVLHTVGIDGAAALLFFKMAFAYFALLSLWAVLVLMPVNYYTNGWIDGVKKQEQVAAQGLVATAAHATRTPHGPLPYWPIPPILTRDALYEYTHLASTYVYALLALYVLWRSYTVFIRLRQGHIREQIQNPTTRTVEVRAIPDHLASVEALTHYFRELHMDVQHVSMLQNTYTLDRLLLQRTKALQRLERAWATYLQDVCTAQHYDPYAIVEETHAIAQAPAPRAQPLVGASVRTQRARPTLWRGGLRGARVDALDELSYRFAQLDRAVHSMRQKSFKNGHTAFVTFPHAWNAQVASQVVHYPLPGYCTTEPAVEPRDILWLNEEPGVWDRRVRQGIMTLLMALLLSLTLGLSATLAAIFRIDTIERYVPWLAAALHRSVRLEAFVTYSLPTLLLVAINAAVPVAMQYSTYFQRIRARSQSDHSVLNKYFLYLLFSVVFVFAFSDARQMLKELAESPERMIDNLAQSLLPVARNFSLSYVIFQALALQPLQLLQLPTLLTQLVYRVCFVYTPRDRAHAIQAPVLAVGTLFPQALLIFTLATLYSIVSPLIVVFGAVYFAVAYVVLKFQLLNVLAMPYDSHGHAWPLAVSRCVWALLLFQVFQLSLFSVRQQVLPTLLVLPLIAFTAWFLFHIQRTFAPLSSHLSLHDIYVEHDLEHDTHHAPPAEDALEDAPQERNTQPLEPALAWNHPGVLHETRATYKQPALAGTLPTLWLPGMGTAREALP